MATAHPDVVAALSTEYDRWALRAGVLPRDQIVARYRRIAAGARQDAAGARGYAAGG